MTLFVKLFLVFFLCVSNRSSSSLLYEVVENTAYSLFTLDKAEFFLTVYECYRIMFLVNCFLCRFLHLYCFPHILLRTLSLFLKLCAKSLSDLIGFKSERPVQHDYSAVSVFAWQMLWLVFF